MSYYLATSAILFFLRACRNASPNPSPLTDVQRGFSAGLGFGMFVWGLALWLQL